MTTLAAIEDIVNTLQQMSEDKVRQARQFVLALKDSQEDSGRLTGQALLDLLAEMRRTSFVPPPGFPRAEELIREDRDR